MRPVNSHKYLVSSDKDEKWGITVDTVGTETVPPGFACYPPPSGHPSGFYFDVGKGRLLESYQLLYIASGRGAFYGADRMRREVGAGDMILLRPNRWHSYIPDRETGWQEYWIGFRGPHVDSRLQGDFIDEGREIFRVGVREQIAALYGMAIEVAENERSSYQQYLAGIANLLLGMAMYYHANHHFVSLDVVTQIDRARRIMRDELGTVSPEQVAERVNMSYSWFRKMFRDYTNISPARYMQQLRLQEACRLLSGTAMSIKEIAFRLNFGDASYFSNNFRRHLRMTPIQYRKRFGVGDDLAGREAADETKLPK